MLNHDIFISFSFKDQKMVEEIVNQLLNTYHITYWICTRDIRAGEKYDDKIYEAIKNSKAFVLIQSRSSVESEEVPKEIRLAVKFKKTIIPFVIEDSEWEGGIAYQLINTQEINATRPTFDERIQELAEEIQNVICKDNLSSSKGNLFNSSVTERYSLNSKIPHVRDVFEGRQRELSEITSYLSSGNRILFLEGVGGIGKSELAKQYAVANRDRYDTVVFLPYSDNLKSLVCDPNALEISGIALRPDESQEEFFMRKLRALRDISDQRTLIIVDNFDVDNDPDFESFVSGSHHIIFTTRNQHQCYHSIKVSAINNDDVAFRIFEKNYGMKISSEDKPYILKLFSQIEYHTYAIELLAKQMNAEFFNGKELLEMFTDGRFSNGEGEKITGRQDTDTAFGHLCRLFSMSNLNDAECKVLCELALSGISGIPASSYWKWTEVSSPKQVVMGLIRKSWIRRENSDGIQKISLHPLASEVIRTMEITKPTVSKCRHFLEKMGDDLYTAWYTPVRENLAITDSILSVAEYFEPFYFDANDKDLLEIWSHIPSFLWQVGRFNESIKLGHIVFESCYKTCGEKSMLTGYAARNLAGCYFNSGRFEESIPWYKKGLEYMLLSGQGPCEDIAISYEKVARCYTWEYSQDFSIAQEYFDKALSVRQELIQSFSSPEQCYVVEKRRKQSPEVFEEGAGLVYLELGRMYQIKKDYISALKCAEKYGEILERLHPENISSLAYAYLDKGVCYYYLGIEKQENGDITEGNILLDKAQCNLQKSLEINKKMRGEVAIDTITNQEFLGDTYVALGDYMRAIQEYEKVIMMIESLLGKEHSRYSRAVKKINVAREQMKS